MKPSHETISDLENALRVANSCVEQAWKASAAKFEVNNAEWHEYFAAYQEQLAAERTLAAAEGKEYAVPVEFPCQWDSGVPMPHLLRNDHRTFLAFYQREYDPQWDGSYVTLRDPSSPSPCSIAVTEFIRCISAKLGSPNDEVHDGHPWDGRGMDAYTAQEVINSRWLSEIEAINRIHRCYDPAPWKKLHHYVFWFHDSTFECLAESFQVNLHSSNLRDVLAEVCEQLVS